MNQIVAKKLKKLLALAERAGTQAEAENAMAKVQAILTRHNITLAELPEEEKEIPDVYTVDTGRKRNWKVGVLGALAELYYCRAIFVKRSGCILIGKPGNVAVTTQIFNTVVNICEKLVKEKITDVYPASQDRKAVISQFKNGFGYGISRKAQILLREAQSIPELSDCKDLIVLSYEVAKKENNEVLDRVLGGTKLKTAPKSKAAVTGAYVAGYREADKVSLRPTGVSDGEEVSDLDRKECA